VIGDSWMVADASWVKMLSNATYEVYPIANTGYQVATANTNYTFDYTAVTNTSDPTPDKVLISFGVNDFNASVTVPAFQASLLALIDKVRVRYAAVPIVLARVPNNGVSLYGQYSTAMSNAVGLRTGVTYIDTTSIDASMTWMPDGSHLDPSGQAAYASFVNPLI
jgi:lysophospholipase L1-like esterase